jgi:hypothetical protein
MNFGVFRFGKGDEIVRIIIEMVTIDMVYFFIRTQFSSELLLQNAPVYGYSIHTMIP